MRSLTSLLALTFPHRVLGVASEKEQRLLFKEKTPEALSESPEGQPEGGGEQPSDGSAEKQVLNDATKQTESAVKNMVPEASKPLAPVPEKPREGPQYAQLPSIREGIRNTRNALLTALGVALPPLGIATLAAAGAGRYVGRRMSKQPISIGRAATDTFVRAPAEGVKSIGRSLLFPFRWAGAAGMNTLKFAGNTVYRGLDATVFELYRDLRTVINHKFQFPEGTNLLAAMMLGVKRTMLLPKDAVRWYAGMWKAHPKTTLAATIAIPWITMHGAWPAVIKWGGDMSIGILNIIQGIAGKIAIPAIPPIP